MSNRELAPAETVCASTSAAAEVELLTPREVPLGGPRAMRVRRTLPQRRRSLIGAWCFLDHYGPERVAEVGGMQVPRHPHTGLQTVSWLFSGEIEHRDSAGHHALVRPGELNLMTAGRGISHSEFSTPDTDVLHGAQLWLALPDADREVAPDFAHHRPEPVSGPGWEVRVFLGSLAGSSSPVPTFTGLLGAELVLQPGTALELETDPSHEHGLLVDAGPATLDGEQVPVDHLGYVGPGRSSITVTSGAEPVRALLLGGAPLGEQIVMWWNFVGRSHEEIAEHRAQWMAEITGDGHGPERFGPFPTGQPDPLPAPALPQARMRPRG